MPPGEPTASATMPSSVAIRAGSRAATAPKRRKGVNDQRVAGQHGERLAIFDVDRGLAATQGGVVETGQIVVDERGAVQKLDRRRGGVGRLRIGVATGAGHGKAKLRADAVACGKHGVAQRRRQQRRRAGALRQRHGAVERLFDTVGNLHGPPPLCNV